MLLRLLLWRFSGSRREPRRSLRMDGDGVAAAFALSFPRRREPSGFR